MTSQTSGATSSVAVFNVRNRRKMTFYQTVRCGLKRSVQCRNTDPVSMQPSSTQEPVRRVSVVSAYHSGVPDGNVFWDARLRLNTFRRIVMPSTWERRAKKLLECFTLKTGALESLETSGNPHPPTHRNIPEVVTLCRFDLQQLLTAWNLPPSAVAAAI